MRHFWIFAHLLGFVLWLGGGLAAMMLGLTLRRVPRDQLGQGARHLAVLYQRLLLPGSVLTVASGLILTMVMYGSGAVGAASRELMTMQATGLLGAILTLLVLVPNASRLTRLDPVSQAQQFDALRQRQARIGMLSGLLGMIALITGALGRP